MKQKRQDNEQPFAVLKNGWRYHHLGIPTISSRPGERYIPQFKMYVSGFDTSEFGIEWMRFDPDSQISEIIQTIPHIAFEVDDLEKAITGYDIISEINSPSDGLKVAMIIENGVPIELMEFKK